MSDKSYQKQHDEDEKKQNPFKMWSSSPREDTGNMSKLNVALSSSSSLPPPPLFPYDGDRLCLKYADDLYHFHRQVEMQRRPASGYVKRFERSTDSDGYLNVQNRVSLIERLLQDVLSLNLREDTLYLAVSILDRYWSYKASETGQMVLAPSCLAVAAKLEETSELEVELLCVTGMNVLLGEPILEMGADILESLKFEIWSPTTVTFLWKFTHMDEDCHPELEKLGCCLAELSLPDYYYVQFVPSMVAASVVFLGKFILNSKKNPWSQTLQSGTGYNPSDLKECVLRLDHFQKDPKNIDALKRSREKFGQVTSLPSEPSIPDDYFLPFTD